MTTKKGPRARKPRQASKAQQILDYLAEHPDARNDEVGAILSAHPTYVRQVIAKYGKPDAGKPTPFTGGTRLVAENGQSDLARATKQIKTLKQIGLERVRELLALLEAIHGK